MVGLIMLIIIISYYYLSKYIVTKSFEAYGTKKAKYIAIAIMILIPTWDVVLGYPIYKYLCLTKSGVKIYKTIDNVEGFYIGEVSNNDYPQIPYKDYIYVDYKDKTNGKYYRNSWNDNNTSENCIGIGKYIYSDYAKEFKNGKCIIKNEINENEVTNLWKISNIDIKHYNIMYLKISSINIEVINPLTKEKYFTAQDYIVDKSWITSMNIVTGEKKRKDCIGIANNKENFINDFFIIDILKPKIGENKNGNN